MPSPAPPSARSGSPHVVLLHASASSARQWQALAATLEPHCRVHALELHGSGATGGHGARPASLADEAARITPVLRALGSVHLVGHSYGGALAIKLALLEPQRVRSLAVYEPVCLRELLLDDTSAREALTMAAVADAIRDALARGDDAAAAQHFVGYWSGQGAWWSLPPPRRLAIAARMQEVAGHFDAIFGDTMRIGELAALPMPMLFMTGGATVRAARRIGELLRAAVPHARHELLPQLGHLGPLTHPQAVNRCIADFLQPAAVAEALG